MCRDFIRKLSERLAHPSIGFLDVPRRAASSASKPFCYSLINDAFTQKRQAKSNLICLFVNFRLKGLLSDAKSASQDQEEAQINEDLRETENALLSNNWRLSLHREAALSPKRGMFI